MEGGLRDFVAGEVVDCVFPQSETRSALCQHKGHMWRTPAFRRSFVVHQNGNTRELQPPILLLYAFVQVGKRRADIDLPIKN